MRTLLAALALVALAAAPAVALWSPVADAEFPSDIEVLMSGDDALYTGTFTGLVFASQDHGASWTPAGDGLDSGAYAPVVGLVQLGDWMFVSRSIEAPYNLRVERVGGAWQTWQPATYQASEVYNLFAMDGALYGVIGSAPQRSDDLGDSWTPLAQPDGGSITRVFAAGSYLFGATGLINSGGIYRSADGGQTWTDVTGPLPSSYLCAETVFGGALILSVYHYGGVGSLWRSDDWGASWTQITGLPSGDRNLNGLAVHGNLLAFGASGSTAGGSVWLTPDFVDFQPFTEDLPPFAHPVNMLLTHDGWLFKSGGSVTRYRAALPDLTGVDDAPAFASRLTAQPNPFNPKTTLRFSLAAASDVSIDVFTVNGRRAATAFAGRLPAGPQAVDWEARDDAGHALPGGIYLARLSSDEGERFSKMVLVK